MQTFDVIVGQESIYYTRSMRPSVVMLEIYTRPMILDETENITIKNDNVSSCC